MNNSPIRSRCVRYLLTRLQHSAVTRFNTKQGFLKHFLTHLSWQEPQESKHRQGSDMQARYSRAQTSAYDEQLNTTCYDSDCCRDSSEPSPSAMDEVVGEAFDQDSAKLAFVARIRREWARTLRWAALKLHRRTASQFRSVAASKCEFQTNATHPVLEPDAHHGRKDGMPQARSFSGTSTGSRRWSCKEEQRTEERCRTAIGQSNIHVLPSRRAALEVGRSESIRRQLTSLSERRPGLPSPGLARTRPRAPRGCAGPAAATNHPRQRNRSRHRRRPVRRGDGKHRRNIEASKEAPQERRHPAAVLARTRRQWSHLQELLSDHAHQAKDSQRNTNNIHKI